MGPMLLLIDNYDSFVYNLARYFQRLGCQTHVVRNDAIDVPAIRRLRPAAIVLSPGPCTPHESGSSLDVVRELADEFPMLGVCLGHQTIANALGARIVRADQPMHGRTSAVYHHGNGLFQGVPSPLLACRYHSLVVDPVSLPGELEITARTEDGTIMAIAHRQRPIYGVQFHPEAVLTEHGYAMLANFLTLAGLSPPGRLPSADSERPEAPAEWPLPAEPVTF
jgi:anthranilate synthase/aminodeoxychorismate synthase-like glutamine amidotransferase